jgi:hypothetical protein
MFDWDCQVCTLPILSVSRPATSSQEVRWKGFTKSSFAPKVLLSKQHGG